MHYLDRHSPGIHLLYLIVHGSIPGIHCLSLYDHISCLDRPSPGQNKHSNFNLNRPSISLHKTTLKSPHAIPKTTQTTTNSAQSFSISPGDYNQYHKIHRLFLFIDARYHNYVIRFSKPSNINIPDTCVNILHSCSHRRSASVHRHHLIT